jgi:hypothetical protein
VDQALNRNHVACYDTSVLQKLLRLFVEAAAAGDYRIRDGEENDLDKLDTDDLGLLATSLGNERGVAYVVFVRTL